MCAEEMRDLDCSTRQYIFMCRLIYKFRKLLFLIEPVAGIRDARMFLQMGVFIGFGFLQVVWTVSRFKYLSEEK